jgi:two-component system, sensor histidine kinase PdtaS
MHGDFASMYFCRVDLMIDATNVEPLPEAPEFLLLRESHHRLMNSFAFMGAYLRLHSDATTGTLPSVAVARLAEMITAQGKLHQCLALRQRREPIPFNDYITRLCRCLSDAVLHPFGITYDLVADAGYLSAWQCERLGLALTELAMNAVKHGFHGRSDGKICIETRRRGERWHCVVADNGCWADPVSRNKVGDAWNSDLAVGSQIVESLVGTLGGTKVAHLTPTGTIVVMTFPAVLHAQ